MVKNLNRRIKKFADKISGDNRKRLYDSQKSEMVRLETKASEDMEIIELQIKDMAQLFPPLHLPYYIIFAKEIYKKQNKFEGETLINELTILEDKWERRGLDFTLLEKIKKFYVPIYRAGLYFIMDESLLDGDKILA